MENAVEVKNVKKGFKIPHERTSSLKGAAVSIFHKKNYTELKALDDISFEVKKGEFFGIVGRNGSGKSTLLKLLAKIYVPDSGEIKIKGRLSPFLELGVGFNPELTARENVYLNGVILGLSEKEISQKFDEIIHFAELEEFVDQKLKNFSSGMQVRLAFSVAIQAHAEVLLLDEVLAVGDANFQEKCFQTFKRLKGEGRTIVLVTHDMNSVKEFCDRAMLIHNSKIASIGSVEGAIQKYKEINQEEEGEEVEQSSEKNIFGSKEVVITEASILDTMGKKKRTFKTGEDLKVTIKYKVKKKLERPNIGFAIYRNDGIYCYDTNTDLDGISPKVIDKDGKVSLTYKNLPLHQGDYYFKIGIYQDYSKKTIYFIDEGPSFRIEKNEKQFGIVSVDHEWGEL